MMVSKPSLLSGDVREALQHHTIDIMGLLAFGYLGHSPLEFNLALGNDGDGSDSMARG